MDLRIVVMGVSGAGKSTLGAALAQALHGRFVDADDLHPPANRAKMAAGVPLNDQDRAPWLDRVARELAAGPFPVVVACSALKRSYRDRLRAAGPLVFVHPAGGRAVLAARLAERQGHFMPPALLDSQLVTLEPPGGDERAITVPVQIGTAAQVAQVLAAL
ncbi:MAG: gluconokinase [Paracoccaceae bacterium]